MPENKRITIIIKKTDPGEPYFNCPIRGDYSEPDPKS